MDNMQKGFLIAGGLLILGFLGYTLFGKKEEEIEDAEYYIVVESNTGEVKVEEKKKASKAQVSDEMSEPKISIVKTNSLEFEEVSNEIENTNESVSTSLLKEIEEIPKMKVVLTPEEIDLQEKENVNEIEVVEPQELIVEANDEFPLKLGSKGQRVWHLKVYLMKNHGGAGIITNEFDKQTQERVKRFLKADEISEQFYKKLNIGQPRKKKQNAAKKKH